MILFLFKVKLHSHSMLPVELPKLTKHDFLFRKRLG